MRNNQKIAALIRKNLPEISIRTDIPWEMLTTLKIGTSFPLLAEPEDDIQLSKLLKFCDENKIPVRAIGAGSNLLGTDKKNQPEVFIRLIKNSFNHIKISPHHVTVGAGTMLFHFAKTCAEAGLGGISALAGIPGTIGGAIRMNAGTGDFTIGKIVDSVYGIDKSGNTWYAPASELKWGYRNVSIPKDIIIIAATCKIEIEPKEIALEKIRSEIVKRKESCPPGRSAGCVFRNPVSKLSAGKLIDASGCKKFTQGDIMVSPIHANYFINNGQGTEKDFISLMCRVKKKVFKKTGIILKPEICFAISESGKKLESFPPSYRITVLKGGNSNEREVSLKSGSFVAEALRHAGYDVREIDIKTPEVTKEIKNSDLVFPILHGGFGENGELQKNLEKNNVPFIGCDSVACEIAMDKVKSKEIMLKEKIPTPAYALVNKNDRKFPSNLKLPVIVKPPAEGSTVGITLVRSESDWDNALEKVFSLDEDTALVESYINGVEITVGIVDNKVLPPVEIRPPGEMYDYDAKYTHQQGETLYLSPPDSVPENIQKKAQRIAMRFFKAIKARDILRTDMIIRKGDQKIFVLEGNNIPGFTESSLLPKAAKAAGISFVELCAMLAKIGLKRNSSLISRRPDKEAI